MENLMNTDRLIDPSIRRRRIGRRVAMVAVSAAVIGIGWFWLIGWLAPSVSRDHIRTTRVETGPVEETIAASGIVKPEIEQALTSPIDTKVIRDLHRPGTVLQPGDSVVTLDVGALFLDLRKNHDQIELNRNQQRKLRLELEKNTASLRKNLAIESLTLENHHANSVRQRRLFELGARSEGEVREYELIEKISELRVDELKAGIDNTQQSGEANLEELSIRLNTLELEREELLRQLESASPKIRKPGVLTWVASGEGTAVPRGSVFARIIDTRSFRVDVTVSDVQAGRIQLGMPVRVMVHEEPLTGMVSTIRPAIENGLLTVEVRLDRNTHPSLKSNLRVETYLVTAQKEQALRVGRGPFINGEGSHYVYVIRDGTAYRTPVRFGLSSFDYFEVLEGLQEGDEVIISNMESYGLRDEVSVK